MKNDQQYFNSDGHLNDPGISLFAESLQSDETYEVDTELKEHVESCLQCKIEINALVDLLDEVGEIPMAEYSDETIPSAGFWFLRVAAIFLLAGILGSYLWFIQQESLPPALAANFSSSPNMEALVDDIYRTSEVRIFLPEYQQDVNSSIPFKWDTTEPGPFTIVIVNNKEERSATR